MLTVTIFILLLLFFFQQQAQCEIFHHRHHPPPQKNQNNSQEFSHYLVGCAHVGLFATIALKVQTPKPQDSIHFTSKKKTLFTSNVDSSTLKFT